MVGVGDGGGGADGWVTKVIVLGVDNGWPFAVVAPGPMVTLGVPLADAGATVVARCRRRK